MRMSSPALVGAVVDELEPGALGRASAVRRRREARLGPLDAEPRAGELLERGLRGGLIASSLTLVVEQPGQQSSST